MSDVAPLLAFIPLHWDMTPDGPDDSIYMTLGEFASQVSDAQPLFDFYWNLRKRYEIHAKPSKPFEVP
jgi:hypothetical protein